MKKIRRFLISLLMLISVVALSLSGYVAQRAVASGAKLVTTTAISSPAASGNFIFWVDSRGGHSIYGYDISRQAEFLVTSSDTDKTSLATDGQTFAWVETLAPTDSAPPTDVMYRYDIASSQIYTVTSVPAAELGGLAFDQGLLYYQDNTPGHSGLYALNLTAGTENLVSATISGSVAINGGTILWSTQQYDPGMGITDTTNLDSYSNIDVPTTTLHLAKVDGSINDLVIATAPGCLNGFNVSGTTVVYAFNCAAPDQRVYEYTLGGSAPGTPISSGPGSFPLISGNTIAWTVEPTGAIGSTKIWSIQNYDNSSRNTDTNVGANNSVLVGQSILGQSILFTVTDDSSKGTYSLYLNDLTINAQTSGVTFPDRTPPPTILNTCDRNHPITCGQVAKYGAYFVDAGGYWPMDGVQFILPQSSGINGSTFTNAVYWPAVRGCSDGSDNCDVGYWLHMAQTYVLAKTLRVYLPLPAENSDTCLACLVDFADRANNHGMRIGVVMRNSTAQMNGNPANAPFVNAFFNYFQNRTAEVAYVNLENEANNHSSSSCRYDRDVDKEPYPPYRVFDCYDRYILSHPYDYTYINKVSTWLRDFNQIYHNHQSTILRTVGISTEMGNADGYPAVNDFFRYPSTPGLGRIFDNVDFLSPHNYAGGAREIIDTLRYNPHCFHCNNYPGPVMLEEFGYPTDDMHEDSSYKDGDQYYCRYYPWENPDRCANTAPYKIEANARAVRSTTYAASSSFMLADINSTPCLGQPGYIPGTTYQQFTGIFSAAHSSCGGTPDPYPAYAKNTAWRIRTHNYYFNPHP